MKKTTLFSLCFGLLALSAIPSQALAFSFNPNNIISDFELRDAFSMDFNQVQNFLNRGALGSMQVEDWQGNVKTPANIILETAQNHGVNPKFLLVLLQKEQSLVEDPEPTQNQLDWATGYAVCDDCSKSDPSIQRWRGFGKQINSAALQFTEGYLADIEETGTTQGKYGPGVPVEVDDEVLVPQNAATASLYAYTPHIHGNKNFAKIWNKWFSVEYPTGSLLQAEGGDGVYLIEFGYKRPIRSYSALVSRFNPDLIIPVSETTLANYPDGRPIDFPNYSLLKDESGAIYLLVNDSIRHIDSMETFRKIGFVIDEVVDVSSSDLALYERTTPLTLESNNPQGDLLQLPNGAVFHIKDGLRHAIVNSSILKARFPNQQPTPASEAEITQYGEGSALTLPDGYLVKSDDDPAVYVISNGEKRLITSEQVFTSFGFEWGDIVTVDKWTLKLHNDGAALQDEIDTGIANY